MARWIAKDDQYLWDHRDNPVQTLADKFSRTRTSIRSRLEHIRDPTHAAYKRLFGNNPPAFSKSNKSIKRRKIKPQNNASNDINNSTGTNKKGRNKWRKKQSGKKWSIEDDVYLWIYRDDTVQTLADTFERTKTSIKCRLEILRDPNSKWRKRLLLNLPKDIKNSENDSINSEQEQKNTGHIAALSSFNFVNNNDNSNNSINPIAPPPVAQNMTHMHPQPMMQYQTYEPMIPQHFNDGYNYRQPLQYQIPPFPMYSNNAINSQYNYRQMQHQQTVIPMQSQYINHNNFTIPQIYFGEHMNNNNGYNEPLKKRQKLDRDALVIPAHVIQQQNKSQKLQIENFKQRMRAEKFYKELNEIVHNRYYIGHNIQIKDSQSGLWINAVVIDKENNWIVAHFDGCSSTYDQQIHVIKNKDRIRNLDEKKKDIEKKEEDNNKNDEEVPDEFCDPITFEPMKEPMLVMVSGHTYERNVIEEYIKENGQDPMTRQTVTINQLVPNRGLRDAIERWMKNHPGAI